MNESLDQVERETAAELSERLKLNISDLSLLCRALTHRSYLNEFHDAVADNERLEFLGDAVLDFIVGAWLYNQFPEMEEGDLTRMRSALVHTEQLAVFAEQLNLGQAIRLGRGEIQAGGNHRPALLCDTFEAIVGALYLDSGIDAVQQFMVPLMEAASQEVLANRTNEDPKSTFQEWAQAQGYPAPTYCTRNSSGPDHSKTFEVDVVVNNEIYGSGTGSSKQIAAKAAAMQALHKLRLL